MTTNLLFARSILFACSLFITTYFIGCGGIPGLETATDDEIINGTAVSSATTIDDNRLVNIGPLGCSGFLLRNNWALTAQHCIRYAQVQQPLVLTPAGTVDTFVSVTVQRGGGLQSANVNRVYAFGPHDLALLRLTAPMTANPTIRAITLATQRVSAFSGQALECYGRGDNTVAGMGFGTWRRGSPIARTFPGWPGDFDDLYRVEPPSSGTTSGQIQWLGDSGGPCFFTPAGGTTVLTGIQSGSSFTCNFGVMPCTSGVANSVVNASQVNVSKFTNSLLAIVDAGGVPGRASGTPSLIQSRYGTKGNFEVVTPIASGGVAHYWRNNDATGLPVSQPFYFGTTLGTVTGVSLIHSTVGKLELAATAGGKLYFASKPTNQAWSSFTQVGTQSTRGNPAIIQSGFGPVGNYEMVVPAQSGGGFHYYWKYNDPNPNVVTSWTYAGQFGTSLGTVDGLSMVQARYPSGWGNIELVARVGQNLHYMSRNVATNNWSTPVRIGTGAAGDPSLIQSRFGSNGNLELMVPRVTGGLNHYWRVNHPTPGTNAWEGPVQIVGGTGDYQAVSLIQTNFGEAPGNLEFYARQGSVIVDGWQENRDAYVTVLSPDPPLRRWSGPVPAVRGTP